MARSKLPESASVEHLRKLARDRLAELQRTDPGAKLAAVLLAIAREQGFPSWRTLKAAVDAQNSERAAELIDAAKRGDLATVVEGLERGVDPNVRDQGDHASALHWSAARGHLEVVRALLDAGADVEGAGDAHALDVIGWATYFARPEGSNADVVELLLSRGAQHHVFSAIVVGDLALVRALVEERPEALDRRMSRFERGLTAIHFAVERGKHDILELLIDLGADLEATDGDGKTALLTAILRGDHEATRILEAAGAEPPKRTPESNTSAQMVKLADTIEKCVAMLGVPDIAETLAWYTSIGFQELARYEEDGVPNFGLIAFGKARLMLRPGPKPTSSDLSLWLYTSNVEPLYRALKAHQLSTGGVDFVEDLYEPFYGGKQFSVRDLNGYTLVFLEPTS
jgi:ankyrin repeat protein